MSRLLVVALVVFAVGCGSAGPLDADKEKTKGSEPGRPPVANKAAPTFPPADWTHKELAEHLGKKGVKVTVEARPLLSQSSRIAAVLIGAAAEKRISVLAFVCSSPQDARDQAGALGGEAFSAGRFAFGSTEGAKASSNELALLARIQAALK